jgi:hypothetical protein
MRKVISALMVFALVDIFTFNAFAMDGFSEKSGTEGEIFDLFAGEEPIVGINVIDDNQDSSDEDGLGENK